MPEDFLLIRLNHKSDKKEIEKWLKKRLVINSFEKPKDGHFQTTHINPKSPGAWHVAILNGEVPSKTRKDGEPLTNREAYYHISPELMMLVGSICFGTLGD